MDNFEEYIAELKRKVDLVELIQEDEPLSQRGREWRGAQHDSLQVTPDKGLWHWWSVPVGGDAISWLEWKRRLDFKSAVELLARKAGMEPPQWSEASAAARLVAQARYDALEVAATFYQRKLEESEGALRYCSRRGWTPETVKAERIGFFGSDYDELRAEFKMHGVDLLSPAVVALVGFRGDVRAWATAHDVDLAGRGKWIEQGYVPGLPRNMLVYPHVEWARVRYFSARSPALVREEDGAFVVWDALTDEEARYTDKHEAHRAGKRHYNLPRELAGDKPVCWNSRAVPGKGKIVLVEGQADKVTLAQWKLAATALLRTSLDDTEYGRHLAGVLDAHDLVYAAVDSDAAGLAGLRELAQVVGPRLRVVQWPDHDANDWLMHNPETATAEAAAALLQAAPLYVEVLAEQVGSLPAAEQADGIDEVLGLVVQMRPSERTLCRQQIARGIGIGMGEYDKILNARVKQEENKEEEQPDDVFTNVGGTLGPFLLETIYEPPPDSPPGEITQGLGKTHFAIRDGDGQINIEDGITYEGKRYVPIAPNSMVREQAVRFAPSVGPRMEMRRLVELIQATIHKYVDIELFYETLSAYYVLFTWVYDAFETLPYLRVKGDTGTGKSRFQQVVGSMCYRPMLMNAGASISSLFRTMDEYQGTLVLDEADFQQSDEASAIAKLLNIGYQRRQGFIHRSGDKNKDFKTELFKVYGPKVIGTRREYTDKAIESRCLTLEMSGPTTREDIPRNLPRTFWSEEIPEIQSLLLRYRLEHRTPKMSDNGAHAMDGLSVEPRLQQVITPLMQIIEDEDMLENLRQFVRNYNKQMISERGMTVAAKVLEALYILTENQRDLPLDEQDFSLGTIAEIANDLMDFENDKPIGKWVRFAEKKPRFKITSRGAGSEARKTLGLHSERRGQSRRYQIIMDMPRLESLWRRYGYGDDETRVMLLKTHNDIQAMVQEHKNMLNLD